MIKRTLFAGFGGQGVLLMGYVLSHGAMHKGLNVTYFPSYGAEMRGGTANCTVTLSDKKIASPVASNPDILVAMNYPSLEKFESTVAKGGLILINSSLIDVDATRSDVQALKVPTVLKPGSCARQKPPREWSYLSRVRRSSFLSTSRALTEGLLS
jgi:2-oxoglutarate ferredoxin oxidoreductase subunit gamma